MGQFWEFPAGPPPNASYARSDLLLMNDDLTAGARRMRAVEGLSVGQIRARLGIGKDRLYEMLRGVPGA